MKAVIYLSITVFASILTLASSGSAQIALNPIMSDDDEPKPQFKRTLANYKLKQKKLSSSTSSSTVRRTGIHGERLSEQNRATARPSTVGTQGTELRSRSHVPKSPPNPINPNPTTRGRSFPRKPQKDLPTQSQNGRSHPKAQSVTMSPEHGRSFPTKPAPLTKVPIWRSPMSPEQTQNGRLAPATQQSAAEAQSARNLAREQVLRTQAQMHSMQKTRFIPMQHGRLSASDYPYLLNNGTKVVKSRSLSNTKTHKAKFKTVGRATADGTVVEAETGGVGGVESVADKTPWTGMPDGKWNTMSPLKAEYTGDTGAGDFQTGTPDPSGQGEGGQDTDGAILDISLPLAENLCALQDGLDTAGVPGSRSNDAGKFRVRPGTPCHVFKWTSCPTNGPQGRPCGWFVLKPC